jgi:cytochrome c peroxidase
VPRRPSRWTHPRGGYYHDGRFATLEEVVAHYDAQGLGLTAAEEADLVEFLRSL